MGRGPREGGVGWQPKRSMIFSREDFAVLGTAEAGSFSPFIQSCHSSRPLCIFLSHEAASTSDASLTLVPFSCPFALALVAFCLCSVSQLFAWFLTSNPWLSYRLMAWLHPVDLIVWYLFFSFDLLPLSLIAVQTGLPVVLLSAVFSKHWIWTKPCSGSLNFSVCFLGGDVPSDFTWCSGMVMV